MPESTSNARYLELDTKHPDWNKWEAEWERYRDVVGDDLVEKETYLPKGPWEHKTFYDLRLDLSQFLPDSGLAIERILGALYDVPPKREHKGSESELKPFLDNANRRGKSWGTMAEEICFHLLAYGTTRTLINVPVAQLSDPDAEVTRDVEQSQNIRPFVINYTPLAVIDWETSSDGALTYIRIKEERTVRNPGNATKPHRKAVRFIEYDRARVSWSDFLEGEKGDWELDDEGARDHNLGVVPMICEQLRDVGPMIGHSFVRYSSRADIQKHQVESDQAYDTYVHSHPTLKVWTEEGLKDLGLGSNSYLKLKPGTAGEGREDAAYIEIPGSAFEALDAVIKKKEEQVARHAKVDPMAVASQGGPAVFQASGAARAWSFGTSEARTLSKIAGLMETIEGNVLEIVLRYQHRGNLPPADKRLYQGDIQYPEEFDMSSTSQLLEERVSIAEQVNSPTLLRTIDKRIASSKVGDTTAQVLKTIHDEIENNDLINTMVGKTVESPFSMPNMDPATLLGGEQGKEEPPQGRGKQNPLEKEKPKREEPVAGGGRRGRR
ncbi:MAG: hypothetical protein JSW58_08150 [Candidatus Latescibacterota bacterium]|nr:MAG: hypothetical protein JSW58_08150 [Candidatus Latescibacterota bacterium]